jgi:hypothetical protein
MTLNFGSENLNVLNIKSNLLSLKAPFIGRLVKHNLSKWCIYVMYVGRLNVARQISVLK